MSFLTDNTGTIYLTDNSGNAFLVTDQANLNSLAQYRLLVPHILNNQFVAQMTVVVEGTDVPPAWVPTMEVDPLNSSAVDAYYAAGPRPQPQSIAADQQGWLVPPAKFSVWVKPTTFWVQSGNFWSLTGLGSSKPPVVM